MCAIELVIRRDFRLHHFILGINLALFLSGPQSTNLPVHIFSQIQWQGDPTIAAASTLQILIIGLLILIVQRIFRLRLLV